LKLILHIHTNTGKVSEKHTGSELTSLIIHRVNGKSDARALVVISISFVKFDQISLVKLILELGSEVDHQSVFRSGFNRSSVGSIGV
jgi:hypothetical protein